MPGVCSVPVSRQSHSLAPPGKSLASLNVPAPSTSIFPQARAMMRGERIFASLAAEEGDALDMAQTSVAFIGMTEQLVPFLYPRPSPDPLTRVNSLHGRTC